MWADCTCGHGPASTHCWDTRLHRYAFCERCVQCGHEERDHGPYAHQFKRCPCMAYREAA